MLGKLLKQEFRATGRIMLPMFGALLLLTVLANLSMRLLDRVEGGVLAVLCVLVIIAFTLGIFGVFVMTLVLMVGRFHRNLLRDEGYLMHTLPVSVHGLVSSKLLVSLVWILASGVLVALIVLLSTFFQSGTNLSELLSQIPTWDELNRLLAAEGLSLGSLTVWAVEFLAVAIVSLLGLCLHFYAAMAMGHMFNKDKVLLSIVFFVAISIVLSILSTSLSMGVGRRYFGGLYPMTVDTFAETVRFLHSLLHFSLIVELLKTALLYFCTTFSLKRGLNLG